MSAVRRVVTLYRTYYGTLVHTLASRRPDVIRTTDPGLVVIQLDGLSHDVLSHSLRAGREPGIARWIRSGSHRLGHWDALLPVARPDPNRPPGAPSA